MYNRTSLFQTSWDKLIRGLKFHILGHDLNIEVSSFQQDGFHYIIKGCSHFWGLEQRCPQNVVGFGIDNLYIIC